MRILVLGANGQLGKAVVERLVADGHHVRAFVRHLPGEMNGPSHLEYFQGDAMNEESIIKAAAGHDIVVNVIGSGTLRKNTVESDTTRVILRALAQTPVKRYIALSAGMVTPVSFGFDRIIRPLILSNLYREHRLVEKLVQSSSLDWTIVRPPRLSKRAPRGYIESSTQRPKGPITLSRIDVADFISKVIAQDRYHHQAVFLMSR
jgi:uncharacterized protein YbjT (DUF2867 family)